MKNIMTLATISLLLAAVCAVIIACDVVRHPQSMKIMNLVWILTALWSSLFGLVAYFWFGRERGMTGMAKMEGMNMPMRPKWQGVTLSTLHCGAGCTLADIIAPLFLAMIATSLIGGWAFTCALALVIGVYFQFVAIREMSDLPTSTIIKKALKADFLSLTAWQVGMYGWIYLLMFHFKSLTPHTTLTWELWFAMQQAMVAGFILALPMNYLLIRAGIKSGM